MHTEEVNDTSLIFMGSINDGSVKDFIQTIQQHSEEREGPRITIAFSSTGGGTVSGLVLYDFLRLCPKEILIVGSTTISWNDFLYSPFDSRYLG